MTRWMPHTLSLLLILLAALALIGCDGDQPADDDDSSSADDDDMADDDDSDVGFSCEALTAEDKALFTKVFCAGSSNSFDNGMTSPMTADDLSTWYHGKIIEQVWINLEGCADYDPELWVYWYTGVGNVSSDVTLSWSIDAFFHYLDDDPTEEVFRQRVSDYLDTLRGAEGIGDDVVFIGANVPELMIAFSYSGDTAEILTIIEEEMLARPNTYVIDLDYYMDKILEGRLSVDGESLGITDIMVDALHVNELGQQLLAELFIMELNAIYPALYIPAGVVIEIDED